MVWRDIKPDNLIVTENDEIRPIDLEGATPIGTIGAMPWSTIGYAANADNSGGILTLGDVAQTHSVSLALLGQYAAASDFAVASDGHGGTLVTLADPSQNHALTLANTLH